MTKRRATRSGALGLATIVVPALLLGQDATTVSFERQGYRLTSLGAKVTVSARVLDARRRAVPNAPIAYRSSDPNVASVTGQGVVQSRRVGRTRVWAVSGRDSASALIMVDQWATTFAFAPSPVTMEAIGVQVPLQIQLKDAGGTVIPDAAGRRVSQCRVRDERVATLSATGRIVAKANGVTWVRCVDRGVSDSVRVEVRQRAVKVMIADKLAVGTKTVPDTFRLRMRALDAKGDTILSARATWASLTPSMVTVDPSGKAQAVGPGQARVVAQVGDATDTVSIAVTGTAIAAVAEAAAAAAADNTVKEPKVTLDQVAPFVGDSVKLTFTAKDPLGAPVTNADRDVRLRSTNDTVVVVNSQTHWAKVKAEGTAFIVAQFTYAGTLAKDSIMIAPRVRNAAGAGASAAAAAVARAFERPKYDLDSAQARNIRQLDSALTSIRESGIGKSTSGRTVGLEFITAQATHATRISSTYSESRSGLLFGGHLTATPFRRLALSTAFRTGNLTDANSSLEPMKVTEMDLQTALWLSPWFGLGGGYLMRGEKTKIGFASWQAANASILLKGAFIGNFVTTNASLSFFPMAKLGTRPDKPEITSLSGDFGMDLRFGFASAGFRYYVENFRFAPDPVTGDERSDQFSTLRFRIGTKIGR